MQEQQNTFYVHESIEDIVWGNSGSSVATGTTWFLTADEVNSL